VLYLAARKLPLVGMTIPFAALAEQYLTVFDDNRRGD
jgi:hypothetical protein